MRQSLPVLSLALVIALFSAGADAREEHKSGGLEGQKRTASAGPPSKQLHKDYSRSTKITGENGKSAERSVDRSWDRKSGTGTYNSSTTGSGGKGASTSGTVTKTAPGQFTNEGTTTTKSGKTVEHSGTTTKNDDGSWSHTGTQTSEKGSRTGTSTTTKTEDGRVTEGSYSNSRGGVGSYTNTTKRDEDGVTHSHEGTHTTADGKTFTTDNTRTRSDGEINYTNSITTPKGETKTKSGTVVIAPKKPVAPLPPTLPAE
jgi:hypothetical protein